MFTLSFRIFFIGLIYLKWITNYPPHSDQNTAEVLVKSPRFRFKKKIMMLVWTISFPLLHYCCTSRTNTHIRTCTRACTNTYIHTNTHEIIQAHPHARAQTHTHKTSINQPILITHHFQDVRPNLSYIPPPQKKNIVSIWHWGFKLYYGSKLQYNFWKIYKLQIYRRKNYIWLTCYPIFPNKVLFSMLIFTSWHSITFISPSILHSLTFSAVSNLSLLRQFLLFPRYLCLNNVFHSHRYIALMVDRKVCIGLILRKSGDDYINVVSLKTILVRW